MTVYPSALGPGTCTSALGDPMTQPAQVARRRADTFRELSETKRTEAIAELEAGNTVRGLASATSANRFKAMATACTAIAEELEDL